MSSKVVTAVMHCTQQEPKEVIAVGIRVRDALYSPDGVALYANPPVDEATLTAQVAVAGTAQGNVKNGGKSATTTRDAEVATLFTLLGKLILYVNGLYKGDKAKLEASGFDTSDDPTPHPIPDQPVIKSIKDGALAHSAKITLAKITSTLNKKRDNVTYFVQMATTDVEANYVTVLETKDKDELLIPNLTRGVEQFFRVAKSNAAGKSPYSASVAFIPQ